MGVSIFDLFSIGVGPSSSHTVGPMRAGFKFLKHYQSKLPSVTRIQIELFGSLALTGKGHRTDYAVLLGFAGIEPQSIDIAHANKVYQSILQEARISLLDKFKVNFNLESDLIFHYTKALPEHANGMQFSLYHNEELIGQRKYFSIGGGFILDEDEMLKESDPQPAKAYSFPYGFESAGELLDICAKNNMSIAEVMLANECARASLDQVNKGVLEIWNVMDASINEGLRNKGELPGGLKVARRANRLKDRLEKERLDIKDLNWLNVFAIAVNEENAAGGKVVTAPTNGAAGVIPAVLKHHLMTHPYAGERDIINYLLTTAAIGILFKKGASISAAEVGCQGEVGVACSMAAAGLCAILGGTVEQVENAAEMGMEHNLGLTCDPIGGLVQIPCIERNAMGAVQAVNAAKLALFEDGQNHVSLDKVIQTMKETGKDMSTKYKETSLGGLAVNLPAC
ncbi:L-serine ammonia-lyase [Fangia hongkongensis]|uniref:L-serine ammonia-lyase n=1 Tax=Fangia hongkongensis TaxID=270495 RepID=UPI00037CF104|nr:L-serine ammonia-lyase [Fangia hongkongensis]MBK2124258.1 L-serine ammonia-lyase [Fangia hongkongensis]